MDHRRDRVLYLDLPGGACRVEVHGGAGHDTGNGGADMAVVLLHHFGGSARSWREVVDAVEAGGGAVCCVAPDLRGFGESTVPALSAPDSTPHDAPTTGVVAGGYAVADYVDDVAALVAALDLRDYVLVGHSMGGKIAAAFAARRPPGLRGLLLVAPSPPWPEPIDDADRARLLRARDDRTAAAESVQRATARPLPPAAFVRAVDDTLRSAPAAWRAWLEHGSREDLSAHVRRRDLPAHVPVRVLVGRRDPVMPRALMAHVARHLGGDLQVASDAGHLLPLESPHTVADAIRALLADAAAPAASGTRAPALGRPDVRSPDVRYPEGTVRALLDTDLVTPATRTALRARLTARDQASPAPRFFDAHEFRTLTAVCHRLIPQDGRPHPVELPHALDARLADGKGDGWRYAVMPPDPEAHRLGLRGLDESARAMFGAGLTALPGDAQDAVLRAVQAGTVQGGAWDVLPAERFFEELLAELAEAYYSHPVAQDEIGYVGYADAHGWQAIGLDERAPHEPRPVLAGPVDGPA